MASVESLYGQEMLVRASNPSSFDWQSTHPHFGSVVHAILFGRIDDGQESAEEEPRPLKHRLRHHFGPRRGRFLRRRRTFITTRTSSWPPKWVRSSG